MTIAALVAGFITLVAWLLVKGSNEIKGDDKDNE